MINSLQIFCTSFITIHRVESVHLNLNMGTKISHSVSYLESSEGPMQLGVFSASAEVLPSKKIKTNFT